MFSVEHASQHGVEAVAGFKIFRIQRSEIILEGADPHDVHLQHIYIKRFGAEPLLIQGKALVAGVREYDDLNLVLSLMHFGPFIYGIFQEIQLLSF
jgi:hypothetical protein